MLKIAGQLLDTGLLAVPEGLLNKRAHLGMGEFRTIKRHSDVSYEVLKPLSMLAEVLPAIRHHHERMNGTGYPAGLVGDRIPLGARILAVADTFDAMTHDRPHRPAMTPLEAITQLRQCSPAGYDSQCVAALSDIIHLPELQEIMASADAPADQPDSDNLMRLR